MMTYKINEEEKRESNPFFAVICTNYKNEKYLEKAIKNVANQSFGYFEFLLVDDASPGCDGYPTAQFLFHKYFGEDDRAQYFRFQNNKGVGFARNYGIDKTSARYILFLDGDDYWTVTHLENLHRHIFPFSHDQCVFLKSGYISVVVGKNGDERLTRRVVYRPEKVSVMTELVNFSCATPFLVFDRHALSDCRFDPRLHLGEEPDIILSMHLSLRSNKSCYLKLHVIKDEGVFYREHAESALQKDFNFNASDVLRSNYIYILDKFIRDERATTRERVSARFCMIRYKYFEGKAWIGFRLLNRLLKYFGLIMARV